MVLQRLGPSSTARRPEIFFWMQVAHSPSFSVSKWYIIKSLNGKLCSLTRFPLCSPASHPCVTDSLLKASLFCPQMRTLPWMAVYLKGHASLKPIAHSSLTTDDKGSEVMHDRCKTYSKSFNCQNFKYKNDFCDAAITVNFQWWTTWHGSLKHFDKPPHCYSKKMSSKQLEKKNIHIYIYILLPDGTVTVFACNYRCRHCEPFRECVCLFYQQRVEETSCAAASKNHILILLTSCESQRTLRASHAH